MWDFLDGLFDRATQTFKSITDFELAKIGAKAEAQKTIMESPSYQAANTFDNKAASSGINVSNVLMYGGLGLGVLFVLKRAKVI